MQELEERNKLQTKSNLYSIREILTNHSILFSNSQKIMAIWKKNKDDP